MLKISNYTSRKIARISLVASLLIIYLHSSSEILSRSNDGSATWWLQELLTRGACRIAVPYFLLVFGIMLFKDWPTCGMRWSWWCNKIHSRMWSLFLPYLVWAIIGMLFCFALSSISHNTEWVFDWASMSWWLEVIGLGVKTVDQAPLYMFHLWFVRFIILVTMVAPIVGLVVRRFGIVSALPFAIMGFFPDIPYWASQGMFFVCIGCYVAQSANGALGLKVSGRWIAVWGVVWGLALWLKAYALHCGWCDTYGTFTLGELSVSPFILVNAIGVMFVWLLYDCIIQRETNCWVDRITGASFFIYCSHLLASRCVVGILKRMSLDVPILLDYLLKPVVEFAFCILVYLFLRRFIPRVALLLTGGRG